jgi:hypothetical protein
VLHAVAQEEMASAAALVEFCMHAMFMAQLAASLAQVTSSAHASSWLQQLVARHALQPPCACASEHVAVGIALQTPASTVSVQMHDRPWAQPDADAHV